MNDEQAVKKKKKNYVKTKRQVRKKNLEGETLTVRVKKKWEETIKAIEDGHNDSK